MLLVKSKKPCVLVMIIGHENPHFLMDTAASIQHYNRDNVVDHETVFAIDNNPDMAAKIARVHGEERVYCSKTKNGWGKGILRTIFHALSFFKKNIYFTDLITFDSDALCTGPFVDTMYESSCKDLSYPRIFFSGTTWGVPDKDKPLLYKFRTESGFLSGDWDFKWRLTAGPCMMWTRPCLDFLEESGWMPGESYDRRFYQHINFAHDQITTYLNSAGICRMADTGYIMNMRWRMALPTQEVPGYGAVPIVEEGVSIIHPTVSSVYTEENCRRYFKVLRAGRPVII